MYKEKGGGHIFVLAAYFHGLFLPPKNPVKKPIPSCHPQRRDVSFPSSRWCELWCFSWNVRESCPFRYRSPLSSLFVRGWWVSLYIRARCSRSWPQPGWWPTASPTLVKVKVHFCTGLLSANLPKLWVNLSNLISACFCAAAYVKEQSSNSVIMMIFRMAINILLFHFLFSWLQIMFQLHPSLDGQSCKNSIFERQTASSSL